MKNDLTKRILSSIALLPLSLFFIIFGSFILKSKEKIWLIILTALGVILSWGNNFEILNFLIYQMK